MPEVSGPAQAIPVHSPAWGIGMTTPTSLESPALSAGLRQSWMHADASEKAALKACIGLACKGRAKPL